ncbi:MAG: AraC family transcriptional regulator [Clostridia bacterium]|nr:AraC family transcriptional regulator [Clostridia bacterium]
MNCKINKTEIPAESFSPKVIKSYLFTHGMDFPMGHRLKERYVFDYELEFFIESKGSMVIDEQTYVINKGDIVFRKPGQYTQGIMPYSCYLICFDLIGNTEKCPETYDFYEHQEFQNDYINPILEVIPPVFHPASEDVYHELFDSALSEYLNHSEYSALLLKTRVLEILCRLYRDVQDSFSFKTVPLSSHYSIVKKAVDYMENHFQDKINLMKFAELSGLSPNYFHKVFTDTMNCTPNEYLTKLRLNKAKEILIKTNVAIYETALQCGFENIPYFSYVFKRNMGVSPAEFRRKHSYIG